MAARQHSINTPALPSGDELGERALSGGALLHAAPAMAAATALGAATADALAQVGGTAMAQAYRRFRQTHDVMDEAFDDHAPRDVWDAAVKAAREARTTLIRAPIATEADFWLRVDAALRTCNGVTGVREEMDDVLSGSEAFGTTIALAILADLAALRPQLDV